LATRKRAGCRRRPDALAPGAPPVAEQRGRADVATAVGVERQRAPVDANEASSLDERRRPSAVTGRVRKRQSPGLGLLRPTLLLLLKSAMERLRFSFLGAKGKSSQRACGHPQLGPQRASRALSTDARLSIQPRASPITAAFVVGELRRALGGPVPCAAFAGGGRLTAGRRGPPGSSFVVLSGRGGQRSAVAQLRRPGRRTAKISRKV
jgi:hypothetical protein